MNVLNNTKLKVNFLNVGHGDCAIIKWDNGLRQEPWICTIDSGKDKKQLEDFLLKNSISRINLAITSHFDLDHIGGYFDLDKKIKIEEYWSPYTPAFKKNIWLFGDRVKRSIERAEKLEEELLSRGTSLASPLEKLIYCPVEGLKIKVLYPAYKLYEKLLSNEDIKFLFESYPTPLNWLIEETDETINYEDINSLQRGLNKRIKGNLITRNLEEEKIELEQMSKSNFIDQRIKELWSQKTKIEPEFFGNHVLNDTSIVLKFEVWTGSRWNTLLFPGDIQNWLYLIAKRPNDLVSDIYKVSHHGSNMYLAQEIKYDEIIQSIRPKLSVISANGQYKLPKTKVRDAITRWSTALACTQHKTYDTMSLNRIISSKTDCCHNQYCCSKHSKATNSKNLGVSVEIKDSQMKIEPPPCMHSAYTSPIPIIQLEQHLVSDSKVLTYLSEREIKIHTEWLKEKLTQIYNDRKANSKYKESKLITIHEIRGLALKECRFLTEKQISQILEYGYSEGKFLSYTSEKYGVYIWDKVYRRPTNAEITKIASSICKKDILISSAKYLKGDINTFLLGIDRKLFCKQVEQKTSYPSLLVDDYIWPQIIEKLVLNFNVLYLPNEDEKTIENILIVLVNKNINYKDYMNQIKEKIVERLEKETKELACEGYVREKWGIPNYDKDVINDYLVQEYVRSLKWMPLSVAGLSSYYEKFHNSLDYNLEHQSYLLRIDKLLASKYDYEYVSSFLHLF
ncbi:ComEC/Rec2 family competence protein [Clostridium magnum]|uniref:Metallo-beta-lactamase domain-containing protein n=1 Tax=Clostridium magnum DSM 2767 TaxID=1121326 RepID=A0A162QJ74_9CLOT|nr:hypothetical protein [Clostridium magnum]KZL88589.1 hypothetical protein CLMAG_60820 [Clostridium magnum DSM 2767]SHI83823.1 hypothetical protein SAMN02745944_04937 [Clostridium magnum DSM 2767]